MSGTRIRIDKQIQKTTNSNMFPLSDGDNELQYVPLLNAVRNNETLTHLNSVEITNGNLVIKYTAENNMQQTVSTPLSLQATDINVANAILENPGAGVYRLVITETDNSQSIVDLSSLVAMVSQNSAEITLSGNGTPQAPLTANLSQAFKDGIPKTINELTDVTSTQLLIDEANQATGIITLCWDTGENQWKPRNTKTLSDFVEITETFRDLSETNSVSLSHPTAQIVPQSIKVFRNGIRQDLGQDYVLGGQEPGTQIIFSEIFSDTIFEKVIVDYRLI